ncbi:MAG: 4-hydroxy-3-methylbut-2-enyl diphosphate reductase, partial [Clostridiales bacterium]|nr:4-hydroxy-3-methylbut-2-enyl diphosphate reductase [Clostridiales bacterium]
MEGKDSIVVAQSAGFCVGVRKAVEQAVAAAELAKEKGLACYSLGELIHNPSVVQHLAEIGIRPVSTPQEAQGGMLLIRSHGVSRHVMRQCEEAAAMVVDCTCPFVARMHSLADSFSADGASVILVGDAQHPEIQGTAGWCNSACYVVSTQEDIACLPDGLENVLVMCQTTFSPTQWAELS